METECKKVTMDIKLKEDQIRELELKVQVKLNACSTLNGHHVIFLHLIPEPSPFLCLPGAS